MRHRPKRENYPMGTYGDIDYQERLERYCTYLENRNKALTEQCNIADVSTRFLPFDSISDLLRKVENIKKAHKIKSETFRQTLKEKGIKFTSIDDYGVAIDISLLSDEDMRFIKNQDDSFIQKVYDENGVVLNVC